jgi:hypothetical protein
LLWPVDCPTSKVATSALAGLANSIRRFLRLSWGGAEMPCIEALGKGDRARTRLTREPFLSQRHRAKRGEVRAAAPPLESTPSIPASTPRSTAGRGAARLLLGLDMRHRLR